MSFGDSQWRYLAPGTWYLAPGTLGEVTLRDIGVTLPRGVLPDGENICDATQRVREHNLGKRKSCVSVILIVEVICFIEGWSLIWAIARGEGCTNLNDLTVVGSCANTRIFKKELGAAKLSFATESIFASPTIPSCKRTQTVVCTFLEQLWTSIESWQWNLIWQQQKTVRSLFLVNCLTDLAGLHRLDASSFSSFRCWTVSSLLQ